MAKIRINTTGTPRVRSGSQSGPMSAEIVDLLAKIDSARKHFKEYKGIPAMPTVVLTNGLMIGNFSSPHSFVFDDGSVLPACDPVRSQMLELDVHERVIHQTINNVQVESIQLSFLMNRMTEYELQNCIKYFALNLINIVLVPLPVLNVVHTELIPGFDPGYSEDREPLSIMYLPFRTIRVKDRLTKVIYSNRFCV